MIKIRKNTGTPTLLLTAEYEALDQLPVHINEKWQGWLYQLRSDDGGLSYLIKSEVGIMPVLESYFHTIKKISTRLAEQYSSMEKEKKIIGEIDEKIVSGLKEKIRQVENEDRIIHHDTCAEITNLLSKLTLFEYYKAGMSGYRYDLLVRGKIFKETLNNEIIPSLKELIKTWETSFSYTRNIFSYLDKQHILARTVCNVIDAHQPEDKQIFPHIKELTPRQYIKMEQLITTVPDIGLRRVLIEGDGIDIIRSDIHSRQERGLCLPRLLKIRADKDLVNNYLLKLMGELYPEENKGYQ